MERRNFLSSGLLTGLEFKKYTRLFAPIDKGPLKPFYTPPSHPPSEGLLGAVFQVKVRAVQTNTQFSCLEGVIEAKTMGPAPHVHKELDEMMIVQDRKISVMVGDTIYKVESGGGHFRPHGVVLLSEMLQETRLLYQYVS